LHRGGLQYVGEGKNILKHVQDKKKAMYRTGERKPKFSSHKGGSHITSKGTKTERTSSRAGWHFLLLERTDRKKKCWIQNRHVKR